MPFGIPRTRSETSAYEPLQKQCIQKRMRLVRSKRDHSSLTDTPIALRFLKPGSARMRLAAKQQNPNQNALGGNPWKR
jgi:hypothetical protein